MKKKLITYWYLSYVKRIKKRNTGNTIAKIKISKKIWVLEEEKMSNWINYLARPKHHISTQSLSFHYLQIYLQNN